MPVAGFSVLHVKLLYALVAFELEEEGLTIDWLSAALRLPRYTGEEAEDVAVLRLADRDGDALVVTQLVELLRREVVAAADIKQNQRDLLVEECLHHTALWPCQDRRLDLGEGYSLHGPRHMEIVKLPR